MSEATCRRNFMEILRACKCAILPLNTQLSRQPHQKHQKGPHQINSLPWQVLFFVVQIMNDLGSTFHVYWKSQPNFCHNFLESSSVSKLCPHSVCLSIFAPHDLSRQIFCNVFLFYEGGGQTWTWPKSSSGRKNGWGTGLEHESGLKWEQNVPQYPIQRHHHHSPIDSLSIYGRFDEVSISTCQ